MAQRKKKLVDLVHLNENVTESQLKSEYYARIASWERWVERRQSDDVVSMRHYMKENAEYSAIDGWISIFLKKRLEWITESVADPGLRMKYLLVLPPFNQKGNIKQFLLHFFQLDDHAQQSKIVYSALNQQEKEIRILWDMYKLTRTLETIQTLRKWLVGRNRSSSHVTGDQALANLTNLQNSLTMVFRICIQKEYQNRYLKHFPKSAFLPESILKRKETGASLVNSKILDSLEYRNYLFFIYFKPKIRGDLDDKINEYEINYLDYEIIRQDFLIHWISERLKNNPLKQKVFEQYKYGNKTFAQITANRPEREMSLLKKLPKGVFDDLMAQVNEELPPEMRAPIDTMSESIGSFSRDLITFKRAKVFAKKSVEAVRSFIAKTEKRKRELEPPSLEADSSNAAVDKAPAKPPKNLKVQLVKSDQINSPFFCENDSHFIRMLQLFKSKIDPDFYAELSAKTEIFLNLAPEQMRFVRRSPHHEWSVPVVVTDPEDPHLSKQLLIIGAELKPAQAGTTDSGNGGAQYAFHPYFVYGAVKKYADLGMISESRNIMEERFFIYDASHPGVISRARKLFRTVIERQNSLFSNALLSDVLQSGLDACL